MQKSGGGDRKQRKRQALSLIEFNEQKERKDKNVLKVLCFRACSRRYAQRFTRKRENKQVNMNETQNWNEFYSKMWCKINTKKAKLFLFLFPYKRMWNKKKKKLWKKIKRRENVMCKDKSANESQVIFSTPLLRGHFFQVNSHVIFIVFFSFQGL